MPTGSPASRAPGERTRVRRQTYEGGHGWHGDVYGIIRAGIPWLEKGRLQTRN
ncbi:MAG: hypothetical protein MUF81_12495 [Verrucomicrobia bacterium]|jgi:hypothetical protein|nr:hypothetical protein [Verrucomicrobiota bacterium]